MGAIQAWYVSELPNPLAKGVLDRRGWEITEIKNEGTLQSYLSETGQGEIPDVILLGGSMEGVSGFDDVLESLRQKRLSGRDWLVVPFSSDPMLNEYMRGLGPRLLGDGIRVNDILGDSPHGNVFVGSRIQALENEIRSVRGGVEGGAAGDPRRK